MSDKEEYGLEDVCTSLDAVETQLRLIGLTLEKILKMFLESKIS